MKPDERKAFFAEPLSAVESAAVEEEGRRYECAVQALGEGGTQNRWMYARRLAPKPVRDQQGMFGEVGAKERC